MRKKVYALMKSCSVSILLLGASAQALQVARPQVYATDAQWLATVKRRIASGDRTFAPALGRLEAEARRSLRAGPFSVTHKAFVPPSGDKHDYMSQAPYFWPNPRTPDGLPYVRRDGERNPEVEHISDHRELDHMVDAVYTLALAYYFTGDEVYAAKAVQLLRVWFLDARTRMNPHLQYAQAIPGVTTGRGIGLIETRGLIRVVDAIGLLAGSKFLTTDDRRGLEGWFARFLQWMLESKNGRDEAAAQNNHGTYYDAQVASFALFLGKRELATQVLQVARRKRIARQIEPDGRQPLELARTRSWSYSLGNLEGLMLLATLAENVGIDLWNYRTADGRSIRRALEYLFPFAIGEKRWPYQQITAWKPQELFPLLRRAASKYRDEAYETLMAKVPPADPSDLERLLYPNP